MFAQEWYFQRGREALRQSGVIGPFVLFASTALDFLIGPVLHKLRSVKNFEISLDTIGYESVLVYLS